MTEIPTGDGASPVFDAATVVLLRPADNRPECLMLRKTKGQAYGGLWVFPGGRVEPEDGTGLEGAQAAAVREAEEETGLRIPATGLVPFAHWLPPPEAPRRFATWFFLAAMPAGAAEVVVDGGEIGDHVWTTAADALERHQRGEIDLVPPTWVTLHGLAEVGDISAALDTARAAPVRRFTTHMAAAGGTLVAVWEPDAGYASGDLGAPGPRHRLVMERGAWRYEQTT